MFFLPAPTTSLRVVEVLLVRLHAPRPSPATPTTTPTRATTSRGELDERGSGPRSSTPDGQPPASRRAPGRPRHPHGRGCRRPSSLHRPRPQGQRGVVAGRDRLARRAHGARPRRQRRPVHRGRRRGASSPSPSTAITSSWTTSTAPPANGRILPLRARPGRPLPALGWRTLRRPSFVEQLRVRPPALPRPSSQG